MKKRTISILLALVMVLSEASMCVFALDAEPQQDINETDLELMEEEPEIIPEENVSSEAKAASSIEFEATASETSATITWDAEAAAGCTIVVKNGSEEFEAKGEDGTVTVDGLTAGTAYTFDIEVTDADSNVKNYTVSTETTVAKPSTPAGLAAYSAYNSVALEWNVDAKAAKYNVYKDGRLYTTVSSGSRAYDNSNKMAAVVGGIGDDNNHRFSVEAVASDGTTKSAMSATVTKTRVKQMYIRITMKRKKTLKSHDKYKTKRTFKKGTTVTAFGFGGGKYRFYYDGRLYYVSYLSTKGAKAIYNGNINNNWSRKEAEYFINTSGVASRTGWLIWVSQYDQHVYVFRGSRGNWRVYDNWEVSTGAAKTPSPTGFGKNIFKKVRNRHGLGPWSRFQSWTSFHGKKKSWKLGTPQSHACIRCPSDKAMWIYKSIPLKTSVNVY